SQVQSANTSASVAAETTRVHNTLICSNVAAATRCSIRASTSLLNRCRRRSRSSHWPPCWRPCSISRCPAVMMASQAAGCPCQGSVGEQLGELGGGDHTREPGLELVVGSNGEVLFDALPQAAQQSLPVMLASQFEALLVPLRKALRVTLLKALLDESLSGGHDDVLGFGSVIAFENISEPVGPDR